MSRASDRYRTCPSSPPKTSPARSLQPSPFSDLLQLVHRLSLAPSSSRIKENLPASSPVGLAIAVASAAGPTASCPLRRPCSPPLSRRLSAGRPSIARQPPSCPLPLHTRRQARHCARNTFIACFPHSRSPAQRWRQAADRFSSSGLSRRLRPWQRLGQACSGASTSVGSHTWLRRRDPRRTLAPRSASRATRTARCVRDAEDEGDL